MSYHLFMPSTRLRLLGYHLMDSFLTRYNPIYRWVYSRRIKARQHLSKSHPAIVAIETTNRCQSHCPMCAHPHMIRPQGVMPNETFREIIGNLKEWQEGLILLLSGYGEPLLDANLADKVTMTREKGFEKIGIFSNVELLTPEVAKDLIGAGLTDLWASVDAIDARTYNLCRPGLDFEKVSNNLHTLSKLRKQGLPRIHVMGVILPQNKDTWRLAPDFWRGVADEVVFRPQEGWAGTFEVTEKVWTPHRHRKIYPPCQHPWTQLNITWDGKGVLCCRDYDAKVVLGQFPSRTPQMMWKLPPLECYRDYHSRANTRQGLLLCENCQYYPVWW